MGVYENIPNVPRDGWLSNEGGIKTIKGSLGGNRRDIIANKFIRNRVLVQEVHESKQIINSQ